MKTIRATKGKKVVDLDMTTDKPTDAAIAQLVIGPSGNLRAPTLQINGMLIVGFSRELYESALR